MRHSCAFSPLVQQMVDKNMPPHSLSGGICDQVLFLANSLRNHCLVACYFWQCSRLIQKASCKHFANELDETGGYQGAQNRLKRGNSRYKMRLSDAEKHSLAQPHTVFESGTISLSVTSPCPILSRDSPIIKELTGGRTGAICRGRACPLPSTGEHQGLPYT